MATLKTPGLPSTVAQQQQQTTSEQFALALFDEMLPSTKIADATSEIGFRRNKIFSEIVDLGLVSRRAVDAVFFIVAQTPSALPAYDVELSYFKWLMTYPSNNHAHLRSVLREAQKAAIQLSEVDKANPNNDRWVSVPLLGAVGISRGRVVFEVHAKLQQKIKDPAQSHFFSLRISNAFTSIYARVLFDHLIDDVENGATEWLDMDSVRGWWVRQDATLYNNEFKYFKRSVLDPAVKQINEVTGFTVTYVTSHLAGSKKIAKIKFVMQKSSSSTNDQLSIAADIYKTLRDEFGLSPINFNEIITNRGEWTNERLNQAIEFTRFNVNRGKVTKSVAGFFMKALRDSLLVATAEKLISEQAAAVTAAPAQVDDELCALRDAQVAAITQRANEEHLAGLKFFESTPPAERQAYVAEFKRTSQAKLMAKRKQIELDALSAADLSGAGLSVLFGQFMLKKLKDSPAHSPFLGGLVAEQPLGNADPPRGGQAGGSR